mmetsp:Transcript_5355/g.20207  ORF Transcript_5355/g.20207 Transcript_5355/m.20207 type:complete len:132 (-) Transcript_5355:29-424(-)
MALASTVEGLVQRTAPKIAPMLSASTISPWKPSVLRTAVPFSAMNERMRRLTAAVCDRACVVDGLPWYFHLDGPSRKGLACAVDLRCTLLDHRVQSDVSCGESSRGEFLQKRRQSDPGRSPVHREAPRSSE